MQNKEIEKLLDCSNCKLKECINCEISYTDKKKIREYIEQLERIIKTISEEQTHKQDNYCKHYCNALLEYKELKTREQKLIEKLEKDIVNITKTKQDGKHCDDYSRCRLKAYRTKTKEILSIVKGEKNE